MAASNGYTSCIGYSQRRRIVGERPHQSTLPAKLQRVWRTQALARRSLLLNVKLTRNCVAASSKFLK
jgi:hypothetical protein